MGLVYVPTQPVGKGATSGNIKWYNPKLVGSGSRAGTIAQGIVAGARFIATNYKFFTGIGSVAVGAGVENLVGQANNQFREENYPTQPSNGYVRGRGNYKHSFGRGNSKYRKPSFCRKCNKSCLCGTMGSRRRRTTRRNYNYY